MTTTAIGPPPLAMRTDLFRLHAELEERHWWFCGRRRILRALVTGVAPPAADRLVVDVGCGTGANIAAFAPDYECLGVDPAPEAIAFARARFAGVRFVRGVAPDDVAGELGRATVLLLTDVLEHVRDDFALLSGILAALPPGAHVLLTVPALPALWSAHDVAFGHFRRYDAARLAALWEGLPVQARLLSFCNARLYPAVRGVRVLSRLRGEASGRAGTDLSLPPAPLNRWLTGVFAGEATRLLAAVDGGGRPYRSGVSLLALLRRVPGVITPRAKPAGLAADPRDPVGGAP